MDENKIDETVKYLLELGRDKVLVNLYAKELSTMDVPEGITREEYVSKVLKEVFSVN